jgi:hypothetical protein
MVHRPGLFALLDSAVFDGKSGKSWIWDDHGVFYKVARRVKAVFVRVGDRDARLSKEMKVKTVLWPWTRVSQNLEFSADSFDTGVSGVGLTKSPFGWVGASACG